MVSAILAFLLRLAGSGVVDKVLGHLERKADSETERLRIEAARQAQADETAAGVVKAGMQFRLFWIPWLMAACPLSAWFGWGVLDSMIWNGAVLPDVAALPPQLKHYADIVWGNLFYAGGGVAVGQMIAGAFKR